MGVSCCQASTNQPQFNVLQKPAFLSQYSESKWPDDQDLLTQIQLSNIYNKQDHITPLKHKVYNRWFWGIWKDGSPIGKGILYYKLAQDSIYYEGDFDGEPSGIGKVVFNGGEWEYKGKITKGKANGEGKLINRKQGFEFEGDWKQSKPYCGNLILSSSLVESIKQTSEIEGDIIVKLNNSNENTESLIEYPDGKKYKGQINKIRFIPQGKGQLLFPNGSKYVGEWSAGQMHGYGIFEWADGSLYDGQYKFGKREGKGKFRFASGNQYEGSWENGKQHGIGTLYGKNTQIIQQGQWLKGVYRANSV